jgi:hypothetical protein
MDDAVAMDAADATQPTVVMEPAVETTQPAVAAASAGAVESCAHCGAALALDQRYCLECGTPRTYLSGMLLERLRAPAAQPSQAPLPPNGSMTPGAAASPPPWQRGSVLTLIVGIGVLLLAMGVGVLIGRSGGSGSAGSAAAPQVITVGGGTGAASTPTTPSAPEATTTTKSGSAPPSSKRKSKAAEPSGVGSSPSKPAPATVLKNLRKGGGGSYEQKSKNLPNVVSTG